MQSQAAYYHFHSSPIKILSKFGDIPPSTSCNMFFQTFVISYSTKDAILNQNPHSEPRHLISKL
ncbi:uncharacterized protein PHALS_14502 [Plasmopara halstedii]|uniref:Uncharacterized protein n=1 Tax=Plasmopara halstedii TaxID=4781 RepID=A0A0P1A4V9_PLAHL|nr:uncharacterized protein PHALS_14502 [Plasmopara halstedii]CEG35575.1 hypothetical protein PHALS_14502 [Plasmopara halstedii]|eukprot:XP_024571944.1 hypothetical protein PHALS_14502 [Plasmopara halstedii]